ncbi:hypothetical protein BH23ACT5_BH23ACT5_03050 [soil metagenome]
MRAETDLDNGSAVDRIWMRRLAAAISVLTALVVVFVLIELTNMLAGRRPFLDSLLSENTRPIQPMTAFLLGSSALAIRLTLLDRARRSPLARWTGSILASIGAVFSTYVLAAFWTNSTGAIPEALRPATNLSDPFVGLPASNTLLCLILINVAILLLSVQRRLLVLIGQAIAAVATGLAAHMVVLYLYGIRDLSSFPLRRSEMAISVAICLVFLGVAALLSRWDTGLVSALLGTGPGGTVLRAALPVLVVAPALMVGIAQSQPILERPRLLGLMAIVLSALSLMGVTLLARTLDRRDRQRTIALDRALAAHVALDQNAPVVAVLEQRLSTIEDIDLAGLAVATRRRSEVGILAGDAHAVVRLDPHRLGIVMVDVAGHGAMPAVGALRLKDSLVQGLRSSQSPASCLSGLRPLLDESDQLATAVVADLDDQGRLRCAVAGHPPPLIVGPDGVTSIEPTGPLLHATVAGSWDTYSTTMPPGTLLLAYTDGLTEVATDAGRVTDSHSVLGLAEDLLNASSLDEMLEWLLDPGKGRRFRDDVTLLVVSRSETRVSSKTTQSERSPTTPSFSAAGRYFTESR